MQRYPHFSFSYIRTGGDNARLGEIKTPHGPIHTPAFIFCGTKATIKSVPMEMVVAEGTQIILSNTYHLMLQPGGDVVEALGGLHKMCGWQGPMFTDSGGYQVFSLGHGSVSEEIKGRRMHDRPRTLTKITEDGAEFKSYVNGQKHLLTPEKSIQIQRKLGADLIVCFDECTPYNVPKSYTAQSMHLSHRWEKRSLDEFDRQNNETQALYGIIQGGVYEDLRQESVDFVNDHDFFAHAIGGSLGAEKRQMYEIINFTAPRLSPERPIHLLGIGGVKDIFVGVRAGIDTFDCVHPTRLGRHGGALIKGGHGGKEHINLRNAAYEQDSNPIDTACVCTTCKTYSRGYIHHLLKAKELLAHTLLTVHNIRYMNDLMAAIRQGLHTNILNEVEAAWCGKD